MGGEILSSCYGTSGLEESAAKINLLFYSFIPHVTSKLLFLGSHSLFDTEVQIKHSKYK